MEKQRAWVLNLPAVNLRISPTCVSAADSSSMTGIFRRLIEDHGV